jgi:hypothetical protein
MKPSKDIDMSATNRDTAPSRTSRSASDGVHHARLAHLTLGALAATGVCPLPAYVAVLMGSDGRDGQRGRRRPDVEHLG